MSVRSEFEKLLKESDHFADVINTNRAATGQILAAFFAVLLKDQKATIETVHSVFASLEKNTGNPSLDAERRHLVAALKNQLQALAQNGG